MKKQTTIMALGCTLAMGTFAVLPSAVNAQTSETGATASSFLNAQDRHFIEGAAQSGLAEVQSGTVASTRALSPAVKQFGQQMVTDHSQSNQKLMQLASSKGNPTPLVVDRSRQRYVDRLSSISSNDFDRMYLESQIKEHEKNLHFFQREVDKGLDPDVKAFAAQSIPTLQAHLAMLRDLRSGSTRLLHRMSTSPAMGQGIGTGATPSTVRSTYGNSTTTTQSNSGVGGSTGTNGASTSGTGSSGSNMSTGTASGTGTSGATGSSSSTGSQNSTSGTNGTGSTGSKTTSP